MRMQSLNILLIVLLLTTGCGEKEPIYSLLSDERGFVAANEVEFNNKIDILFVVDNSGSMSENQNNLANNFNSFIQTFSNKNYDFQIAMTGSDAWRAKFSSSSYAQFKDKGGYGRILTPNTPNLLSSFAYNIQLGISGSGDERSLESMVQALTNPINDPYGLVRDGSHVAIIIVTDEEDFAHPTSTDLSSSGYGNTTLYSVESFIDQLDVRLGTGTDRYSIHAIGIDPGSLENVNLAPGNSKVLSELGQDPNDLPNSACLAANNPWGKYAARVKKAVNMTDGVFGNICDTSFASALENIARGITKKSTKYCLDREPVPSSIFVQINGTVVPEDPNDGWTYDPSSMCLYFSGAGEPAQGDYITVKFDPVNATE